MYVQMWYFLECSLADRVPDTQSLIRKATTNSPCDARHHGHECRARGVIKLAHIMEMLARNDKRMAGMELP